jgi:hypothetical protein
MRWIAGLWSIVVLGGALCADVGDLTPVAIDPDQALQTYHSCVAKDDFSKPTKDDGTVNKRAGVASFRFKGRQSPQRGAIGLHQ